MSVTVCTGTIEPYETKTVTAPWLRSKPDEICLEPDGKFGWEHCVFDVAELTETELAELGLADPH